MSNDILVAVYGSLKSRESNNGLLITSKLIGTGYTTNPSFDLLDMGAFPAAIPGSNRLDVEVWSVDSNTLSRLDRLESHPHFYRREEEVIQLDSGGTVLAWMYSLTSKDKYSSKKLWSTFSSKDRLNWSRYGNSKDEGS